MASLAGGSSAIAGTRSAAAALRRPREVAEEQVVQRRVGQHHPEVQSCPAPPRRPRARRMCRRAITIGRARSCSISRVPASSSISASAAAEAGSHQRERPILSMLAFAQRRHRLLGVGATGEVIAAKPLHRHDRAFGSTSAAARTASSGTRPPVRPGPHSRDACRRAPSQSGLSSRAVRSAHRTGVRLGVKAPVPRVLILRAAELAHRKARHRRQRTVVGNARGDREARPAVGAVDERVAMATVARVVHFARGTQRRSPCPARRAPAGDRPARTLGTI